MQLSGAEISWWKAEAFPTIILDVQATHGREGTIHIPSLLMTIRFRNKENRLVTLRAYPVEGMANFQRGPPARIRAYMPLDFETITVLDYLRQQDPDGDLSFDAYLHGIYLYFDSSGIPEMKASTIGGQVSFRISSSDWVRNALGQARGLVELTVESKKRLEELRRRLGYKNYDEVIDEAYDRILGKEPPTAA